MKDIKVNWVEVKKVKQGWWIGEDLIPRFRTGKYNQVVVLCEWRTCLECKSIFLARKNRSDKYCSSECYNIMRKKRKERLALDSLTHSQRWYKRNKEKVLQQCKEYAKKNREAIKVRQHKWYLEKNKGRKRIPKEIAERRVGVRCAFCNKEFFIQPNIFKKNQKNYCTMDCRNQDYRMRLKGENSHFWEGGKTEAAQLRRTSAQYREWRFAVFERDNFTCQYCGARRTLEAHHIKEQAEYPDLIFDVDNGLILCSTCHKKTNNYGRKIENGSRIEAALC